VIADTKPLTFYGWRVASAAFVLAVFGWGVGFYGPPIFLSVLHETRGWPLALLSTAVTVHFLTGAVIGAKLPALYRRFCAPTVTKIGALCLAAGVLGWSIAAAPWQLLVASALSGVGWGAMSAAAVNSIVSPWFVRARPAALGMAYNGGSIGGVIFSPLWVAAIGVLGFSNAAAAIGLVTALTMWLSPTCSFLARHSRWDCCPTAMSRERRRFRSRYGRCSHCPDGCFGASANS
jgi:MFS family permease